MQWRGQNAESTIIHRIFEANYFLCKMAHYRKSLISVFKEIVAGINKIFILVGGGGDDDMRVDDSDVKVSARK